jgi:hypothetical protein
MDATMTATLLHLLIAAHPHTHALNQETAEAREARMTMIAESITRAVGEATCQFGTVPDCTPRWKGSPQKLAALVYSLGEWETGFQLRFHAGVCNVKKGECDYGHARGPWQLHSEPCVGEQCSWAVTKEIHARIVGTDPESTYLGAWGAVVKITNSQFMCKTLPGTINAYARGGCADFEYTEARTAHYRRAWQRYKTVENAIK